MPELPEVETTRRGIYPHLAKQRLRAVEVRNHSLRWPVPEDLHNTLAGKELLEIRRRGKYLLFEFKHGHMIVHLGMSGSLRLVEKNTPPAKHDHLDFHFSKWVLRFNDPRRFGCVLWTAEQPSAHTLLQKLGPEPLSDAFHADYLYSKSRKRKQAIKTLIMDSHIVVGVGNIYANEALFRAGVHPLKAAGKVSKAQFDALVTEIKQVLSEAIGRGGTTLRDFIGADGKPGYFAQQLCVYGRGGEACVSCDKALTERYLSQRSTVYCTQCQR